MTQSIQEEALRLYPPSMLIEDPSGEYYRDDEYGYDECQRNAFIAGAKWALERAAESIDSNGMILRESADPYWEGWDDATKKAVAEVKTLAEGERS